MPTVSRSAPIAGTGSAAARARKRERELDVLRARIAHHTASKHFIARSRAMQEVLELAIFRREADEAAGEIHRAGVWRKR